MQKDDMIYRQAKIDEIREGEVVINSNQEAREILANLEANYRDLDPLVLTNDSIQLVNKRIEALGVAISALREQEASTWECKADGLYSCKCGARIEPEDVYKSFYCYHCGAKKYVEDKTGMRHILAQYSGKIENVNTRGITG